MDGSREDDLRRLRSIFTDVNKHLPTRRAARRSFVNIQEQMKDRHLTRLRFALIMAMRKGNQEDAEKIEKQIIHYSRKKGWKTPQIAL